MSSETGAWKSSDAATDEDVTTNAAEGKPAEDISMTRLSDALSEPDRRSVQIFWQPLNR